MKPVRSRRGIIINKKSNIIDELLSSLPEKKLRKAYAEAEKVILQILLSEIREKRGIRQEDLKTFSQSGASKLESRKDMKISTLIEYLDNLGLGIEIKAYPKNSKNKSEKEILILKA